MPGTHVVEERGAAGRAAILQMQAEDRVREANRILAVQGRHLEFEVDLETREVVIRVVDDASGEVVRRIPPEEMESLVDRLREGRGILVDGRF